MRGGAASNCGEISAIYRFNYSIRQSSATSRLPITMNIVFPAASEKVSCKEAAQRWLSELRKPPGRTPKQIADDLFNNESGPLSTLVGGKISRLELNIQTYRKPAFFVPDFGSEATYVIRVFQWKRADNPIDSLFEPVELPNQINRDSLLCSSSDTTILCTIKEANRRKLVAYLQQPTTVGDIDKGILSIPAEFGILSKRAVSISPGGSHRSGNQPYWRSPTPDQQVISDEEIETAIKLAKAKRVSLSHIGNARDFRTRLNDSTCTGCHQTRAIAGFHFPGADRHDTPRANSVLVPGSPHFYGDQPRRLRILELIAKSTDGKISRAELATSFSARPHQRFTTKLGSTHLIGGWGGACLMPTAKSTSKRKWGCRAGLKCELIFQSRNDPGVGTCVPDGHHQIGDAVQRGTIYSPAFGFDIYQRTTPKPITGDTRITNSALPANPASNSYYGHHQEFHLGSKAKDYQGMY